MNQATTDWLGPNLAAAADGDRSEDVRPVNSQAWPSSGDVHFQAIAGDVRQAPGANGTRDVTGVVQKILDRVRRSIRERSNGST